MRKICAVVLLMPALAWAEPRSADDWYKEGENQYNLGNFDKAVDAFKQAFSLENNESRKAVYLFNVAQSYRQANDCKNAYFFYKRFLSLKDADASKPLPATTRKQVEDRISELEACAQQAVSISKKPPNNNLPPDGEGDRAPPASDPGRKEPRKEVATAPTGPTHGDEDEGASVATPGTPRPPHLISARVIIGGTKVSTNPVDVPVQPTFVLVAGYPVPVAPKLTVEAGVALTFTAVPYELEMDGESKTGQMWGLLANVGATYEVIPKLGVRVDAGLGALFFANLDGSRFLDGGMATGALTMFHVRGALSGEYAITPNLVVTVAPIGFSYSPPKEGLLPDIKSITSIDFAMVGIGYRK